MNDHPVFHSLKEAYALLQVSSPGDLARKFIEEDQRLLTAQAWDYKNSGLVLNKVKEIVESALDGGIVLDQEDNDDLRDILWFWYHHATGYAIWGDKDKLKAQEFSEKALKYQIADNPNRITRLLYFLVRSKDAEATAWLKTIINEPDKGISMEIMKEYLAGNFFKSKTCVPVEL